MEMSTIQVTVGTILVSTVAYILGIGYQRRSRINALRKQGVVRCCIPLYS
jgi:hypothetical protein